MGEDDQPAAKNEQPADEDAEEQHEDADEQPEGADVDELPADEDEQPAGALPTDALADNEKNAISDETVVANVDDMGWTA